MAYPDSKGDRRHYLACFDLQTGQEYWKQPIAGEIITAPVLADGHVYLATLDGTLYCFRQDDGHVEWQEPKNATSSPVVWEGSATSASARRSPSGDPAQGGASRPSTSPRAKLKRGGVPPLRGDRAQGRLPRPRQADARVAALRRPARARTRPSASRHAKGDAKMHQAMSEPGPRHTSTRVWAYQGSKPFVSRGRLYAAHGDTVSSADPRSDEVFWKKTLGATPARSQELLDSPLTPPAMVNGKLFFGTVHGEVLCLSADTGDELWSVPVGEPIVFQPAVRRAASTSGPTRAA